MQLQWIDYLIILIYFAFVLGIGFVLKNFAKTSTDFFLSGRSIPAWITGLAFISANLGAQEVIGMGASGAKYGIATSHFYWIGAIPAMVFVGIFMMPFYYGSRARSVPEYLKLRFDEKTRGLNAISFAGDDGVLVGRVDVRDGQAAAAAARAGTSPCPCCSRRGSCSSTPISAASPPRSTTRCCSSSSSSPASFRSSFLGLRDVGGADGLYRRLADVSSSRGFDPGALSHSWQYMGTPAQNPMGVEAFGLVMGLGFVLSFGYWCTDFLVVQRAMAADSMNSARRTPLIAAFPKMVFPFLVILPGMIAISVTEQAHHAAGAPAVRGGAVGCRPRPGAPTAANSWEGIVPPKIDDKTCQPVVGTDGRVALDYDLATPMMLMHYFPAGMLGLGLCALMASFMSGMAGNTTAFNTVWTYDIYQSYINQHASDEHYLRWGGRRPSSAS